MKAKLWKYNQHGLKRVRFTLHKETGIFTGKIYFRFLSTTKVTRKQLRERSKWGWVGVEKAYICADFRSLKQAKLAGFEVAEEVA